MYTGVHIFPCMVGGGWMGHRRNVRILKIRTQKWMVPKGIQLSTSHSETVKLGLNVAVCIQDAGETHWDSAMFV